MSLTPPPKHHDKAATPPVQGHAHSLVAFSQCRPPPSPAGDTPSSPANCSGMTVDQDISVLISELEQLKREWEETLGSGARPEEGQLRQENMQLRQEKQQLLRQNNQLRREKDRLARQNSLIQLKSQTLADENIRLVASNSRLSQELKKCGDRTTVETLTLPPAIYIDDYSGY